MSVTVDDQAPVYADLQVDGASLNPDLTYTLTVKNVKDLAGNTIAAGKNQATITRTLYLNIIWHQHQPLPSTSHSSSRQHHGVVDGDDAVWSQAFPEASAEHAF